MQKKLKSLDIFFKNESVLHDEIVVEMEILEKECRQRIFRKNDNKELIVAKAVWE